jgi:hypothetical protein
MLDEQHDVVVSDLVTTDVDRLPANATIEETAEPVSLSQLVSPDMGFDRMLDALRAKPTYFVGWGGEVVGVLSRADPNKPPARATSPRWCTNSRRGSET